VRENNRLGWGRQRNSTTSADVITAVLRLVLNANEDLIAGILNLVSRKKPG
jgi:hypothetical protein